MLATESDLPSQENEGAKYIVEELQSKLKLLTVSDESSSELPAESSGAPKSLLSLSQSVSEALQNKLRQCVQTKSDFEDLQKEFQGKLTALKDSEERNRSLLSEINQLEDSLARIKNEGDSRASQLENDVRLLQKGWYSPCDFPVGAFLECEVL